eukprot:1599528-Amphidinium_carterae.1
MRRLPADRATIVVCTGVLTSSVTLPSIRVLWDYGFEGSSIFAPRQAWEQARSMCQRPETCLQGQAL